MFKRDKGGSLYYEGKYAKYSLLEGITDNKLTSDIVFIFREPTEEQIISENYVGEVIGFVYGAFEDLSAIEDTIKRYEENAIW